MTTMQIDRAVVDQALEALLTPSGAQACSTCQNGPENEYCCRMEMWSAITALRAALAQQDAPEGSVCARCGALAFDPVLPQQDEPVEPVAYIHRQGNYWDTSERHLTDDEKARGWTEEPLYTAPPPPQRKQAEPKPMPPEQRQRWEELAAMPQQAEPAQDIHGACPTHCCPVHGCKYMHDECPVVSGAVQPVYPRNNGCESCADEAEPLNLSDRAVQRRLAAQWGYVHEAQQAEPVEPVAWSGYDLDGMVEAFSRVIEAHYQRANPFQNPIDMDAQMALRILRGFIPAMKAYAVPPQRKLVPLTEEEIKTAFHAARNAKLGASQDNSRHRLSVIEIARAVERAHGIKE